MPENDFPGAIWLREHWENLIQINFQWVAANGSQLVAHNPDFGVVMETVVKLEMQNQVVYAFIDFPEIIS